MDARRRGQAMVEFALVVPVFMLLLFGFLSVWLFAWGQQSARAAAANGALAGNGAMSALNEHLASHPEIGLLKTDETKAYFANNDCLERRDEVVDGETTAQSVALVGRLGWDWGCLAGSEDLVDGVLDAAIARARADLDLYAVPMPDTYTITACYLLPGHTAESCAVAAGAPGNLSPGAWWSTLSVRNRVERTSGTAFLTAIWRSAPAPAALRVEISFASMPLGAPGLSLGTLTVDAASQVVLARWLPACPAPVTLSEARGIGTAGDRDSYVRAACAELY